MCLVFVVRTHEEEIDTKSLETEGGAFASEPGPVVKKKGQENTKGAFSSRKGCHAVTRALADPLYPISNARLGNKYREKNTTGCNSWAAPHAVLRAPRMFFKCMMQYTCSSNPIGAQAKPDDICGTGVGARQGGEANTLPNGRSVPLATAKVHAPSILAAVRAD